ncbi:MAG: ATP-binding protein [Nanoarchaeota archaeon]|nr:ATP-binding protein [Nanoarchaeota archaeon]
MLVRSSLCGVWVCRTVLLKRVLTLLDRGLSVCVVGKRGVGKTLFLKHLEYYVKNGVFVDSCSLKPLLEKVCESKGSVFELKQRAVGSGKVLLVDEVDVARKNVVEALTFFLREGVRVVGAGRVKPKVLFDAYVEIKDLGFDGAGLFARHLGANPKVAGRVRVISRNPERIALLVRKFLAGEELKIDERREWDLRWLFGLSTLFLCLRYVFYGMREYKVGYAFATVAYLLLFIKRIRK